MIKPDWLKIRHASRIKFTDLKTILEEFELNTVCTSAMCQNLGECWTRGTATFMILGSVCTRNCRFCAVKKGKARERPDLSEPIRVAEAAEAALGKVIYMMILEILLALIGQGKFCNLK